jgi:hypothetical protein
MVQDREKISNEIEELNPIVLESMAQAVKRLLITQLKMIWSYFLPVVQVLMNFKIMKKEGLSLKN